MNETLKILFTGDFCPINRVEKLSLQGSHEMIFNDFLPFIQQVDIAVTNLECPLINTGNSISKTGPSLKANVETISSLKAAGFNLVTLANNHIMDYGLPGLESTFQICKDNGIDYVGAGHSLKQARNVLYKSVKGKKLAFINFTENEFSTTQGAEPGANSVNLILNFNDISAARQNADFIFVIVHGGLEHYPLPSPGVKERYRFLVDAGADAVIGHHTHCSSGYEIYKGKPIFYSLGNFVFDSPKQRNDSWYQGVAIEFDVSSKLQYKIIPFIQCDMETAGVRLMKEHERKIYEVNVKQLNAIIADDYLLNKSWQQTINEKQSIYYGMVLIKNKVIRKLINKKILPIRLIKRSEDQRLLLNLIRCETHREILIDSLKKDL